MSITLTEVPQVMQFKNTRSIIETSIVPVLTPRLRHFRDAHKNKQTTIGYLGLVIAYISFQEIVELITVIIKPSNV
jgi:hypothetical protein